MTQPPPHRWIVLLTCCLAAGFRRGYLPIFGLLGTAIIVGALGLPLAAYFCFAAIVLAFGGFVVACGVWVSLFAFVLFRRRLREESALSAWSGLVIFLAAGAILVYLGLSTIWGFFSQWPFGYWPHAGIG